MQIGRLGFSYKVIIAPITDGFILELVVMEKYRFILEVGEEVSNIRNKEFILSTADNQFHKTRLLTMQTVNVPVIT